ncbi:MAG: DNA-methyltransferase [Dehalococcoidia bacterium]
MTGAISRENGKPSGGVEDCLESAYTTELGQMYECTAETFLQSEIANDLHGKVHLILTSPPFPLKRKKAYGNLNGEAYLEWLASFAPRFRQVLAPEGSLVMELGNAWEPGRPVMSTLPLKALLEFLERGSLQLCQCFVCHNPARLPGPAQWVTIERIRVKDAFTNVWWMSPSERPKADNRLVLKEYSSSMRELLRTKRYNAGKRPSQHDIGKESFLKDNRGAIPPNVLQYSNTASYDGYLEYCRAKGIPAHPARMPPDLPAFFIEFLTDPGDLVVDPFAGSNVTGAVAERLRRKWVSVEPNSDYVCGSLSRFDSSIVPSGR